MRPHGRSSSLAASELLSGLTKDLQKFGGDTGTILNRVVLDWYIRTSNLRDLLLRNSLCFIPPIPSTKAVPAELAAHPGPTFTLHSTDSDRHPAVPPATGRTALGPPWWTSPTHRTFDTNSESRHCTVRILCRSVGHVAARSALYDPSSFEAKCRPTLHA